MYSEEHLARLRVIQRFVVHGQTSALATFESCFRDSLPIRFIHWLVVRSLPVSWPLVRRTTARTTMRITMPMRATTKVSNVLHGTRQQQSSPGSSGLWFFCGS